MISRWIGKCLSRKLAQEEFDAVLCVAVCEQIAYLDVQIPILYYSDATVEAIKDYYPEFRPMGRRNKRSWDQLERLALSKAKSVLYSNEWARASASTSYGVEESKTAIVHMGANLHISAGPILRAQRPRSEKSVRLLLVGVHWDRKGGDIAVEAINCIRRWGYDVTLTVVGCKPGRGSVPDCVKIIDFVDKTSTKGLEFFNSLYKDSDLFIFPTQAEASPIVLCEAAAFGLPVVATNTGGVSSIVADGTTGLLLAEGSDGNAFAQAVIDIWSDRERYYAMSCAARSRYESVLNWRNWADRVLCVLDEVTREV
ncbi:glycosyltransferase family 4 protein [Alsobacter sp. SYSU BS001988]